jgi:lysophospholipase L1-like esterase
MTLLLLSAPGLPFAAAPQDNGPRPTIPVRKDPDRHEYFLKVAKAGGVDLLFVGDSITDRWRSVGRTVWQQYFAPLKAANFGVDGDGTEHVIWRLRNGELEGIKPKLVVLLIGTNDYDAAPDVAAGIKTIISDIQGRLPRTKILLLGLFPRNKNPATRRKYDQVNELISHFDDTGKVAYLDIGPKFLEPTGALRRDLMPDFLHPNEQGYQVWADAIIGKVKPMMR